MNGEAGEVADIVKKSLYQGHPYDKEKLVNELGDVLWYVALLSMAIGVDMDQIAAANIRKLRGRYPDGFKEERSLNREEND